jgi:hypothetical protein
VGSISAALLPARSHQPCSFMLPKTLFGVDRDAGHRLRVFLRSYFEAVMKKILQSVALALAAILAVQPALATMTCAQKMCADGNSSADCCLPQSGAPMHGMSNVAAMPSMSASGQAPSFSAPAGASCITAPCCTVSSVTGPQSATPAKFDVSSVVSLTPVGETFSVAAPVRAGPPIGDVATPAHARYILFQAFRI